MNKITTKVLSLLSVFAILLTMLPASFTAFAAETKVQIENADGFGTSMDITIGDGYVIHAGDYWCMIHTADSKRAVYCLEPGKSVSSGDKYNEDAAGEYLQNVNNKILDAAEIQNLLGRVFLYGFTGNLDSVNAYYRYIATQLLVWEVIVGQRDMNFNRVSNGDTSVETALTKFQSSYAAKMVSGYYYDYESAIKNHLKSVSFASYSEWLAVRNAMQSGSDGTYTFTDKNGVLSVFDASVTNGSVVSKSGNSLTVQAENGKTAVVTLTQNNVNASGELTGFLTLTNDSKQTLAELQASPRTYYAAVKGLEKFTVEVTKQDSETISAQGDATLSGAVYGLYRDGKLLDEYVTDENSCFRTKEYVCGNYTIQEISPSTGYLLDDTVYPVGAEPEHQKFS